MNHSSLIVIIQESCLASMPIIVNANNEPKVRQCNSIEIVKTLCYNSTVAPYLLELLTTK